MANSKLESKTYNVPSEFETFLGSTISYENLKMTKTRLNKLKNEGNLEEFEKKGGENALKWINNELKKDRDAIYNVKKTGMDAGRENQFIKKHEKDKNANPTAVGGLPKLNKGNISRKILTNKEVYNESINKEIDKIKYLMEYINNNKKQNL
jgi:thymidylate synthase